MTPHRRLDQIEPVMADVLQKVDRLIEGHGQIITEVSKIPGIETNTNNTAEAVAKLTVSTQRQYEGLKGQFDELKGQTQRQHEELKDQTQRQYEELKGQYNELKASQNAIMQYLREKLP